MAIPATAAALIAAQAIEREGLRLAGALVALVLAPALILMIGAGMVVASVVGGIGDAPGPVDGDLPPPVPPAHLVVMLEVSRDTGVPWELLAAIASVESGFGANMSTSWAGAIGYGQFMPPSWAAFGEGGDPYDYRDVVPAMARYLLAANVLHDIPNAVYAYNHSWDYVALVLDRAHTYATLGPNPAAAPGDAQANPDRGTS